MASTVYISDRWSDIQIGGLELGHVCSTRRVQCHGHSMRAARLLSFGIIDHVSQHRHTQQQTLKEEEGFSFLVLVCFALLSVLAVLLCIYDLYIPIWFE